MIKKSKQFPFLEEKHDGGDWRITSPYGIRIDPISGKAGASHLAVDIATYLGTKVFAPVKGHIVAMTYYDGGGRVMKMVCAEGEELEFMHLNGFAEGLSLYSPVEQGQLICYTGNSGARTTGAHLHFAVKRDGVYIDPLIYLVGIK